MVERHLLIMRSSRGVIHVVDVRKVPTSAQGGLNIPDCSGILNHHTVPFLESWVRLEEPLPQLLRLSVGELRLVLHPGNVLEGLPPRPVEQGEVEHLADVPPLWVSATPLGCRLVQVSSVAVCVEHRLFVGKRGGESEL